MEQLLDQIGCAICSFELGIENSVGEIHHIVEGGKRISHNHVIPLCRVHHREGTAEHPSRHSVNGKHGGRVVFEQHYGVTEGELLQKCESWLDRAYCSEDEQ